MRLHRQLSFLARVTVATGIVAALISAGIVVANPVVASAKTSAGSSSPPAPPTNVVAIGGQNQAIVSWTAPTTDGGSPITGYTAIAASQNKICATTGSTTCTITNLTGGAPYTFTVVARNAVGTSTQSSASSSVTPTGPTFGHPYTWVQSNASTATLPSPRHGAATTYDAATGDVLVFGGIGSGGKLNTTWEWNGTTWTEVSTTGPSVRTGASMAYDTTTGDVILFGGLSNSTPASRGTTWEWNGTAWTELAITGPSPRYDAAMAYDPTYGGLILFGGAPSLIGAALATTWIFRGTKWGKVTAASPPARSGASMTYSAASKELVLYGGANTSSAYLSTTWAFNTVSLWRKITTSGPVGVHGASLVNDTSTGASLLFGGVSATTQYRQTSWALSGTTWSPSLSARGPEGRTTASMAYDPKTNESVLFGGSNQTGTNLGTTWVLNYAPPTAPNAPVLPRVTAGLLQVRVYWMAPTANGALITSYTVTASPSGKTCTTTGGSTSCTVPGLTGGVSYTFTVVATNSAGTSPASSASAPVTPISPIVPAPPARPKAIGGPYKATVTWTAPTDGGSPITGYTVTSSPKGLTCTTTGATTCTVTGLTGRAVYTFTVMAKNAVGTSQASPASTPITTTGTSAPATMSAPTVVRGNQQVTVEWTAPTDGGTPITGFTVTSTPTGRTCTVSGATTCTVTGLTNGTAYTFTVTATNSVGTSPSSPSSVQVVPASVPSTPSKPFGIKGSLQVTMVWTAPTDGGSAISGYTVTSTPTGKTCTTTGATTCVVTELTNGTAYTFTVTAHNVIGTSSASAASSPVTPAVATTPPVWTDLSIGGPSGRSGASMVYDTKTKTIVMFGGYGFPLGYSGATWTFNGSTWVEKSSNTGPTPTLDHSMAYDPKTGDVVLFGGGDTWNWNGTTWTEVSTYGPSGGGALTYDANTGNVVLFVKTTTWTWNGTTWTKVSTSGPSSRDGGSLAYDTATGEVVMFGGVVYDTFTDLSTTWTWNGTTWTEAATTGPTARYGASMAYAPFTGSVILFGGDSSNSRGTVFGEFGTTWAWNGIAWTQLTSNGPHARGAASMAYDRSSNSVVLFGGVSATDGGTDDYLSTTWILTTPAVTTVNATLTSKVTTEPNSSVGSTLSDTVVVGGVGTQSSKITWKVLGPLHHPSGYSGDVCPTKASTWLTAPTFASGTLSIPGDGTYKLTAPGTDTTAGCYTWVDELSSTPPLYSSVSTSPGAASDSSVVEPTVSGVATATSAHVGAVVSDTVTVQGITGVTSVIVVKASGPMRTVNGVCPTTAVLIKTPTTGNYNIPQTLEPSSLSGSRLTGFATQVVSSTIAKDGTYKLTLTGAVPAAGCYSLNIDLYSTVSDYGTVLTNPLTPSSTEYFAPVIATTAGNSTVYAGARLSDTVTLKGTAFYYKKQAIADTVRIPILTFAVPVSTRALEVFPSTITWSVLGPIDPSGGACPATPSAWSTAPQFASGTVTTTAPTTYTITPGSKVTAAGCYTWVEGLRSAATPIEYNRLASSLPGAALETSDLIAVTAPAISVKKTEAPGSPNPVTAVGQVITYDFLATNTGNTALTTVHITDTQNLAGTKLTSGPTCPTAVLAVGASETCTGTYTVTQANLTAGSVGDSAVATGKAPSGKTVTSPPSKLTTIKVTQKPSISVKKTEAPGSPNPVTAVGQVITYDFAVANTGNVPLKTVHVTDTQNLAGTKLTSGPTCPTAVLAVSASETCTATYTVTQANLTAGSVGDVAVATGKAPSGKTVTSPPSKLTTIKVTQKPLISVKAVEAPGSPNPVTKAGQTVTYDFAVTNTGNVPLKTVHVTDVQPATGEVLVAGPTCPDSSLTVGASESCTATYKTTQANVTAGLISNTGTAAGTGPTGKVPTATATVVIPTATTPPAPPAVTTPPATNSVGISSASSASIPPTTQPPLQVITGGGLGHRGGQWPLVPLGVGLLAVMMGLVAWLRPRRVTHS